MRTRPSGKRLARPIAPVRRIRLGACCTPSSLIPVLHSSERTFPKRAILWRGWTPPRPPPGPATYMVALSTLWRVRPYRWRLLSPTTASCSLATVSQALQLGGRRRRRGQSHNMEVPLRGRRWPPMACRSPQTSSVLLWCAWRPSSSSSSRRGLATVTVIGLGS